MKPAPIDPPEVSQKLWANMTGEIVLDIGANAGQSLGWAASRFHTIHAFEPATECQELLYDASNEVFHRHAAVDIFVHSVAVSAEPGEVKLLELANKIDTGQLCTENWDEWNDDGKSKVRTVPCVSVDSFCREKDIIPDCIKIDVEGHEFKVLAGAARVLVEYRPSLIVEIHSTELGTACKNYLRGIGYPVEKVFHPSYPPGHRYRDFHYWIVCYGLRGHKSVSSDVAED